MNLQNIEIKATKKNRFIEVEATNTSSDIKLVKLFMEFSTRGAVFHRDVIELPWLNGIGKVSTTYDDPTRNPYYPSNGSNYNALIKTISISDYDQSSEKWVNEVKYEVNEIPKVPVISCFVATSAFENENHPTVDLLRNYRDEVLINSRNGRNFISWYYLHGPNLAKWLDDNKFLKPIIRKILNLISKKIKKTMANNT